MQKSEKTENFTKNGNFTNFHDSKKGHGAEWGSEIFIRFQRYNVQNYGKNFLVHKPL